MIKNKIFLEVKRAERVYQLSLDPDSQLGECFDVLSEMRAYVIEKLNEAEKSSQKPEEKKDSL